MKPNGLPERDISPKNLAENEAANVKHGHESSD
jgi:hypothetical protein